MLGTALGGPLAGGAIKILSEELLGDSEASEKDLAKYIQQAKPEDLVKLKEIESNYQIKMKELGIDLEELEVRDRESARKREVDSGDKFVPYLASFIIVGFFMVVTFVVTMSPEISATVGTLIGYLSAKAEQVVSYYFGSSLGSKQKTKQIGESSKITS